MRILIPTLAVAVLALSGCAMTPAETARAQARDQADRVALDEQLAGLKPVATSDCLDNFRTSSASLSAYGNTLVYKVNKDLVYVNDTTGGCEAVARGDILVTKSSFGRLCRGDIGRTVDAGSRFTSGSCGLGSFTTYRR